MAEESRPLSRAEQIDQLRSRMAALGGGPVPSEEEDAGTVIVGGPLRTLLPYGGLPRQAVTHVSDTPALIVEILDRVAGTGGFAGVVGWPQLSYAGVGEGNLERVVAVPDPGLDAVTVAGVLAEGLDLVVMRTAQHVDLSPVRARPLLARLRTGRAALVTVGASVPSPAATVTGEIVDVHGVGRGVGRIAAIDIRVRVEAKGARPASRVITLGTPLQRPGLRVVT
ncbi:hypothetical protein CAPI_01850 [Corynebacterium capitovis DSM 44611]|nr:hypothetical protein CAPI_01850 [Corynebacterium capitovis DSM 44611]